MTSSFNLQSVYQSSAKLTFNGSNIVYDQYCKEPSRPQYGLGWHLSNRGFSLERLIVHFIDIDYKLFVFQQNIKKTLILGQHTQ